MKTKSQFIQCDCTCLDHAINIQYFEDEHDPVFIIATQLRTNNSLLRRLWIAIQYVIFPNSFSASAWEETLVSVDDANKIKCLLQEYLGSCVRASYKKSTDGTGCSTENSQDGSYDDSPGEIPQSRIDV